MDALLVLRFILFFVLLFLSAIFSGIEIALFSLSKAQVDIMREKNGAPGRAVAGLLKNPRRLLVTIYIGNETINVAIAAVATVIALNLFEEYATAIAIGFGTFMLLVFGDTIPKTFALNHAEKFSLYTARPLMTFSRITYPVQAVVTWVTNTLLKAAGGKATGEESTQITEDELKTMLIHGEDRGVIESEEKEMIINVFELGDTQVTDIMTPRTEIFALPLEEGLSGISRRAVLSNYSRIPVYKKEIDHIQGILYVKDLLAAGGKKAKAPEDLLRKAYFIPATKKIDALLREFQKKKIHMAIILDEYGGVEGLVTLEDILEEVVGEPADMKEEEQVLKLETGEYVLNARLSLEDFNERFNTEIVHEDVDTVGGYAFHLFGRMPRWGESVSNNGITFTVKKLKGQTISQLLIRINRAEMNNEEKGKIEEKE